MARILTQDNVQLVILLDFLQLSYVCKLHGQHYTGKLTFKHILICICETKKCDHGQFLQKLSGNRQNIKATVFWEVFGVNLD